jgi:hypothetical protein
MEWHKPRNPDGLPIADLMLFSQRAPNRCTRFIAPTLFALSFLQQRFLDHALSATIYFPGWFPALCGGDTAVFSFPG